MAQIKVAISEGFLPALVRLPKAQQIKATKFITNFQKNPMSSGINYEKIHDASHPDMRSVRIDQAYRGIVLKPASGNVYLLLWIDHHDEAYAWARKNHCSINAETGAIQVYEVDERITESPAEGEAAVEAEVAKTHESIAALRDRELMRLGIPEELLPLARSIATENDLDALESRFPAEASEALYMLLSGYAYETIINEREAVEDQAINTSDFAAALDRLVTKSKFFVADDELELQAVLNAPLDKWRVFLHPSQRKMASGNKNGAVRILGGAGTGKTVVAMHRAKWLAEHVVSRSKKVLFTTFTRNLATDIQANLASICSRETLAKIEVMNLDQWVNRFLRQRNYEYQIVYDGTEARKSAWMRALDLAPSAPALPEAFYREEWQRVIQPQSITSLDQYKRASRIGRGTRLNRSDRVKIWPVFEEYRNLLTQYKQKEVDDGYRDAAQLIQNEAGGLPYAAVVVDEAQDMSTQAFHLLRQLVPEGPNDLFIVGDGHQRIYGRNKVVLSRCGINVRGRARKLRLNYRTTEEIRQWAVNLLEGFAVDDLDGGADDNRGYKSLAHGVVPQVEAFDSFEQQCDFIASYLNAVKSQNMPLHHICIVARVKKEFLAIRDQLTESGIATEEITAERSGTTNPMAVNLATMHRVKGLEFDEVILASMNDGLVPLSKALECKGDAVELRQADLEERALVYVAMTRAKKKLIITSYGQVSPYLESPIGDP